MSPGTSNDRRRPIGALQAQHAIDLFALRVAPALTGGLLAYSHSRAVGEALLVALCMLAAGQLIERSRFPLALMPAARVVVALSAPALGAAAALGIGLLSGNPIPAGELEAAVVGAWIVVALGGWTKARVEATVRVRVAVVGGREFARDLTEELSAAGVTAYEVMGWIGPAGGPGGPGWLEWLGPIENVREAVLRDRVDLIVCGPEEYGSPLPTSSQGVTLGIYEAVAGSCLDLPVRMIGANQFYEELLGHVPIGTIDAAWYRYIMHPRFRSTAPSSQRLFDLVVGSLMALLAVPLLIVAALAVKLTDGGPALYRQRRLGEHGEEFEILKLRTMVVGAEPDGEARWSEAEDDRVTRVGRLLRRSHVDELPQLWNVLRGEMTVVGPRPERTEMVHELERQLPHYTRRHLVKPGIAGWAALRCGYAGSELGTAWKLCHDLYYVKHRSVFNDLLILVETGFVTFRDAHRALRTPDARFILGEQAHG